jgi:hypothetical protein
MQRPAKRQTGRHLHEEKAEKIVIPAKAGIQEF